MFLQVLSTEPFRRNPKHDHDHDDDGDGGGGDDDDAASANSPCDPTASLKKKLGTSMVKASSENQLPCLQLQSSS